MGLSAEWDQSQEAAGCSAAQELQSTPFALPPCTNSLAPQEGPSASSPLGHFFFLQNSLYSHFTAEEPGHAGSTRSQERPSSARWVYSPLPFMA